MRTEQHFCLGNLVRVTNVVLKVADTPISAFHKDGGVGASEKGKVKEDLANVCAVRNSLVGLE